MPLLSNDEPPSHGYEPRVIEGFFGPATLSTRGFLFKGRDVAALGDDLDVPPPTPNILGGRIDLSAVARGRTHLKVTASATDASWADIKENKGWPEEPTDVLVTAEAGNADGATTYLVGYDFGNTSAFARVSRPKRQTRIISTANGGLASRALSAAVSAAAAGSDPSLASRNSRAVGGSATWFQKKNHVRLEGEADFFEGRVVGWGTYTLNEEADQINSTGINLVERERGFVISPFTAATAVAAAGVEAEFGLGGRGGGGAGSGVSSSGRWKGALAFDFNKYAPYLAIARETSRAPRWLRRLAPPATSGKGFVGGVGRRARGDLDDDGEYDDDGNGGGSARIAAHLSPADRVAMLTLELGNGGKGGKGGAGRRNGSNLGGVVVGNALSSSSSPASTARPAPAPLKAFVRARTDGKGFARGQGLRGVLAGLSGGVIFNHTVEI